MIDVAIIGGGIGGLAVARFLLNAGLKVRVFEKARSLDATGAGIWMTPNAMAVLDRLGLAEQVETAGVDIEVASLCDQSGRTIGAADYRRIDTAHGFGTVSIRRSDLQAILIEALPDNVVQLEAEFVHLQETGLGVDVKLSGGAAVAAKLLIGADGMRSRVRACIRPEVQPRPVGGICWRGVANVGRRLASSPRATEFWGDGTRFGVSPVGDGVYWYAVDSRSRESSFTVEPFLGFPEPVPSVLRAVARREAIATLLEEVPSFSPWHSQRVVLLGDAAHGMSPNLGQGGAMALEDAFGLAAAVARHGLGEGAFHEYESLRRPRVERVARESRHLGWLAESRGHVANRVRNAILRMAPQRLQERRLAWLCDPALGRFEGDPARARVAREMNEPCLAPPAA